MVQSAKRSVKRWVDGDLEGADEDTLKEHLPSLHAKVLEARHNKSQGMGTITEVILYSVKGVTGLCSDHYWCYSVS